MPLPAGATHGESSNALNTWHLGVPLSMQTNRSFVYCGSRGSGKTYACVAMCSHFEKMHSITRTFLICPTKASNDVFQNLKTLDEQNDVCDDEEKSHTALNNIMREVKRDWAKYDADLLYQKVTSMGEIKAKFQTQMR